jgi:alkanesulfonate monooxygenase SsuD/methylene tetrahydromethanopterin reductase-like flavin-dependent oxidoreductase (luciferase family)
MQYGLYIPNYGAQCSARALADLAHAAEEVGWDGFFIWDHLRGGMTRKVDPMVDPWVALAAIAMNTARIRLGTTVTPVPRRHPWKLARETVSLDHLSNGRLILGVGLGEPQEYTPFGQTGDTKVRAAMLDEALEVLTGLWRGKPFTDAGKHYKIEEQTSFQPPALQQPRIPIWVGGFWPRKGPFRRAARWDGTIPLSLDSGSMLLKPKDVRAILAFIQSCRASQAPYDFAVIGWTPGGDPEKAQRKVRSFARAGATWWLESLYLGRDSVEKALARIHQGPPRI